MAPDSAHDSKRVDGLTQAEAARRLARYGPNEPAPAGGHNALLELLKFCANPLVLILLCASAASAFLGERLNALIIAVMVVLSVALNFIQAYRSALAAQRLRARVAPSACVLRDGRWLEIPRREVVPGDNIRLVAGDMIPADARLLESSHLHVQQAALTGESMPAEKNVTPEQEALSVDSAGAVFMGSSVVSGAASALVVATGPATLFGDIATRLAVRAPETEFDRGTRHFGVLIMQSVLFLVMFLLIVSVALHHDPLQSLLFAVALAVGLTPEFLPMITTVTLSRGAVHMARHNVIVKHLASIQNFGSIDVLCSDKTGTLTRGDMELASAVDPSGATSERALLLAFLNSSLETGIKSPLDAAIVRNVPPGAESFRKTDELPFDFERRRLSITVELAGRYMLITKGAPESILQVSSAYEVGGKPQPLSDEARLRCNEVYEEQSRQGFRVLAVAYRDIDRPGDLTIADERDLIMAGFLTFRDPPLEGVQETLQALKRDGVRVKILTGDNELVTAHICSEVGIDFERAVLGDELESMSDVALAHVAEQEDVFARVSPAQKNRIILALKSRSHVVGYVGDGINDAPSLHAADVGISVASAVDVAKDAADIILLEKDLQALHSGIIEGRRACGNVLKYLLMGTSSNFGNMFSMAGAALFLPFLPMLPTQILLNNFLYDLAQVTIPTDNVDPAYTQKPQRWDMRLIRNFMLVIGPISSLYDFLTFYILLKVFHASETAFHTGWFVESLATQTLVLFVIRTAASPLTNRPSLPLTVTTLGVVALGIALPFSNLAPALGFTPLPAGFFAFLVLATLTYLLLVEVVKRRLISKLLV
jgi:Mg2+-importing ATPase